MVCLCVCVGSLALAHSVYVVRCGALMIFLVNYVLYLGLPSVSCYTGLS